MKYGMNLLFYTGDLGTDDKYLPIISGLKQRGYDGVEVPSSTPARRSTPPGKN